LTLTVCPLTFREAATFVQTHHRHHPPPAGHKFSIGVCRGNQIVGVAMIGRPVARHYDDGLTLEVNRTCTDGTPNANSMLYGAAWRAAKAMGYRRLITRRIRFITKGRRIQSYRPTKLKTRLELSEQTAGRDHRNAHPKNPVGGKR